MYIDQATVDLLTRFATETAAGAVGSAMWGESQATLQQRISENDPRLAVALDEFTKAYQRWFEFHKRLEAAGHQAAMSPSEATECNAVIEGRDATRKRFLEELERVRSKKP